jgi:hypothetical protein
VRDGVTKCIDTSVWIPYLIPPTQHSKGEDLETLSYIRNAGWEIWHNPDMVIEHFPNAIAFGKGVFITGVSGDWVESVCDSSITVSGFASRVDGSGLFCE